MKSKWLKALEEVTEVSKRFSQKLDERQQASAGDRIIIEDFLDDIIRVSKLRTEEDARTWAKWIDSVDTTLKNGYCFVGEFINEGTVEVEIGRPRLILAQASLRDNELRSGFLRQFRVIKMDAEGKLIATHIATDDQRNGWALRIRDLTANFLKDLNTIKPPEKKSRFSNVEI